jgi:hypothetical protein
MAALLVKCGYEAGIDESLLFTVYDWLIPDG